MNTYDRFDTEVRARTRDRWPRPLTAPARCTARRAGLARVLEVPCAA